MTCVFFTFKPKAINIKKKICQKTISDIQKKKGGGKSIATRKTSATDAPV